MSDFIDAEPLSDDDLNDVAGGGGKNPLNEQTAKKQAEASQKAERAQKAQAERAAKGAKKP